MSKLLVLLALLASQVCAAQQYTRPDHLAVDRIDEETHLAIKRSDWQVLRKASLSNPLNIYFRVSSLGDQYVLELKVTKREHGFVVGRNEPLEFYMEDGHVVVLYNSSYQHSTPGAGSRNGKNEMPGVWLTYPIGKDELKELQCSYVMRLRLHSEGSFMGCGICDYNSELLHEDINLVSEK